MKKLFVGVFVCVAVAVTTIPSFAADFKLHRYAAKTWNTNSYWLESDSGIVLIDTQLFMSDAALKAAMIQSTGKPVVGAIITHAHGDHTGGINTLKEILGEFPVYSTQATADHFGSSHAEMLAWKLGDDFDPTPPKVTNIIEDGAEITLAGIKFLIDDVGPGEHENNTVIFVADKNILFSGDATLHGGHMTFRTGRTLATLAQYEYIKANYGDVEMLYSGHGDPARPNAILDPQIDYINFRIDLVKEALQEPENMTEDGSGLKDAVLEEITRKVIARDPHKGDYGYNAFNMIKGGLPSIVKELMAAK